MLALEGVTLGYGRTTVVHELHLTARDGEVLVLLGPSGCGKSTLLRAIAGLEPLRAGRILLDDHDLAGLRPDQREVGLMFQEQALFPHRTVAENVAFGPRVRGLAAGVIEERVAEALALVGLEGTGDRPVDQLSGGERQRVALARAIAPRPRLLMLDEPLGSLDRALQARLLDELPRVLAELGTTVVYVTHDQDEALSLADRVAVLRAGRLQQLGSPIELWRGPRTVFVARFLGLEPVLDVTATDTQVTTPWGTVDRALVGDAGAGTGSVEAVVLADALRLADGSASDRDAHADPSVLPIHGVVEAQRFRGDHLRVTVVPPHGPHLPVPVRRGRSVPVGREVVVHLAVDGLRLLAPEAEDHLPEAAVGPHRRR
ncbi:MAG: ABC transporter ATP-binding protein [Nitriliruptoraceae bacterium]